MIKTNFQYLRTIAGRDIGEPDEVFKDERLCKSLWIEFLLNPQAVKMVQEDLKNPAVKKGLTKALSWYFAFRWLLKRNFAIEQLQKKKKLTPYSIRGEDYRKERRNFLKGIIYARLC